MFVIFPADLTVLFTFDVADRHRLLWCCVTDVELYSHLLSALLTKWLCVRQGGHLWLAFLTLLYCAGVAGVFLHPLVCGGTDRLPHLPDLSQPDYQ